MDGWMDGWMDAVSGKKPLIVDMAASGEIARSWRRKAIISGRFLRSQIIKTPPRLTPCFVSISNHQRPMQHATTVKQTRKEGVAHDGCHWGIRRRAILVGVTVSYVQTCHPSAVKKCVSQGTSPGTSRDKIQHYRSRVDRYKISEREGV